MSTTSRSTPNVRTRSIAHERLADRNYQRQAPYSLQRPVARDRAPSVSAKPAQTKARLHNPRYRKLLQGLLCLGVLMLLLGNDLHSAYGFFAAFGLPAVGMLLLATPKHTLPIARVVRDRERG